MADPETFQSAPMPYVSAPLVASTTARPGILTTIGVLSIVIGALSLISAFLTMTIGQFSLGIMRMGSNAAASAYGPPVYQIPVTDDSPQRSSSGLSMQQREGILKALISAVPLSEKRKLHLEQMLKLIDVGFTADPDGTVRNIHIDLRSSGQNGPAGERPAHDFLVTSKGRIELYDLGALFEPADGSPKVRVVAGTNGLLQPGPITNPVVSNALTGAQADALVNPHQQLNDAQRRTLKAVLMSPQQDILPPADVAAAMNTLPISDFEPNGDVRLLVDGRWITVTREGRITNNTFWASTGPPPNAAGVSILTTTTILSLLLACYLLGAGILALRGARLGLHMHQAFIFMKLAVALAAIVGFVIMMNGADGDKVVGIIWFAGFCLVGCIYPIALIFALRSESIKMYYNLN